MSSQRTVTAVEGYRKPGSSGWDKTWIGLTYDDGNHYMAIFDDGKDFVPDGQTVPVDVYNKEKNSSLNNGWTEEMTPEQIKQVSGVSIGHTAPKTNSDDCIIY